MVNNNSGSSDSSMVECEVIVMEGPHEKICCKSDK